MLMMTLTKNGSKEEMNGTKQLQHFKKKLKIKKKSQKRPKATQPYLCLSEELITSVEAYPKASAKPLLPSTLVNQKPDPYHLVKNRL